MLVSQIYYAYVKSANKQPLTINKMVNMWTLNICTLVFFTGGQWWCSKNSGNNYIEFGYSVKSNDVDLIFFFQFCETVKKISVGVCKFF